MTARYAMIHRTEQTHTHKQQKAIRNVFTIFSVMAAASIMTLNHLRQAVKKGFKSSSFASFSSSKGFESFCRHLWQFSAKRQAM